jgi:hypothetical protein
MREWSRHVLPKDFASACAHHIRSLLFHNVFHLALKGRKHWQIFCTPLLVHQCQSTAPLLVAVVLRDILFCVNFRGCTCGGVTK